MEVTLGNITQVEVHIWAASPYSMWVVGSVRVGLQKPGLKSSFGYENSLRCAVAMANHPVNILHTLDIIFMVTRSLK